MLDAMVFIIKYNPKRLKARLITLGHAQTYGVFLQEYYDMYVFFQKLGPYGDKLNNHAIKRVFLGYLQT